MWGLKEKSEAAELVINKTNLNNQNNVKIKEENGGVKTKEENNKIEVAENKLRKTLEALLFLNEISGAKNEAGFSSFEGYVFNCEELIDLIQLARERGYDNASWVNISIGHTYRKGEKDTIKISFQLEFKDEQGEK